MRIPTPVNCGSAPPGEKRATAACGRKREHGFPQRSKNARISASPQHFSGTARRPEAGLEFPQPRHWRAVAKQAREWQLRQGDGHWFGMTPVEARLQPEQPDNCEMCRQSTIPVIASRRRSVGAAIRFLMNLRSQLKCLTATLRFCRHVKNLKVTGSRRAASIWTLSLTFHK